MPRLSLSSPSPSRLSTDDFPSDLADLPMALKAPHALNDPIDDHGNRWLHRLARKHPRGLRQEARERSLGQWTQALLQAGADPDVRNHDGDTPLHLATRQCYGQSVMAALLECLANPDVINHLGNAPLHESIDHTVPRSHLLLLVSAGANVNLPNAQGDTALHRLLLSDIESTPDMDAINILLQAGARCDLPNAHGETVLSLAKLMEFDTLLTCVGAAHADVQRQALHQTLAETALSLSPSRSMARL